MGTFLGILVGLLVLSVMMLVHELGHFLAGKALGFKIISFNLFMGPVLFDRKGKDGVHYTIRLVPMGASVEFADENSGINELPDAADQDPDYDPNDPSLFFNRPRWARAIVIVMGPVVNFITAIIAFAILFSCLGGVGIPRVDQVVPQSPAAQAGIEPGDRILEVNDYGVSSVLDYSMATSFDPQPQDRYVIQKTSGDKVELTLVKEYEENYRLGINYTPQADGRMILEAIDPNANGGEPVLEPGDEILSLNGISVQDQTAFQEELAKADASSEAKLIILRDGKELTVTSNFTRYLDPVESGFSLVHSEKLSDAFSQAFVYPVSVVRSTVKGLGLMFSGKIKAQDGLTGPVGIVSMVGGVVSMEADFAVKFSQILMLFAFISVAVGFTNLLPIPPFDGFQLLILAIEGVLRRDIPRKVKEGFATVGLILILLLVVYIFYIDITRLF